MVLFQDGDLLVDYIFSDTDERKRFAQVSHEYLIEQVQFTLIAFYQKLLNQIKVIFFFFNCKIC